MAGSARQQRKPKIDKPVGTEFSTATELKEKEEHKRQSNKVPHYISKKKIIYLPAPKD
jgi:glucose-6-phosphate 1-dehydrogenase